MKKILFAASEAVPFIKTGGLADVAGTLPKYFDKKKYDVRVILPRYLCIKPALLEKMTPVTSFYMYYSGRERYVGVLEAEHDGIKYYFIDNEEYFGEGTPYTEIHLDIEKYIFFCKALLSALPLVGFKPDIVHCHDWQSGLVPVYLKDSFHGSEFFRDMKSVMTIHNLRFQGSHDMSYIQYLSGLSGYYFTYDKLANFKDANMLKGGLVYADAITTVSGTYAEEIKTPFFGEGMEGLLSARSGDLRGIVNGIDYDDYNPKTDKLIPHNFDARNVKREKVKNKRALQEELGLEPYDGKFLIGIVSRLTDQKGFDLIAQVMDELCGSDLQIAVLGTGDKRYEDMFKFFQGKYPGTVAARITYSDEMSHKIYAGCDAFLMPSLFEPCGLSQLMSMRYGTLPIVRETGGLKDTVQPYNEYDNTGTGFSFANYDAREMLDIVRYARSVYCENKPHWFDMVKRAMKLDYSWQSSALSYQEMYDWLIGRE